MGKVAERRLVAAALAVVAAGVDLLEKTFDANALHHPRSAAALVLMAAVTAGLLTVVPRIPSWPVAAGAGLAAGGAVGNLVSGILWWGSGVPDPLVVRAAAGGIAFNLADVFVLVGDALLLTSATVHALRNRGRLRQPV
jgi:lipoprotein signal peptidase